MRIDAEVIRVRPDRAYAFARVAGSRDVFLCPARMRSGREGWDSVSLGAVVSCEVDLDRRSPKAPQATDIVVVAQPAGAAR